MSKQIIFLSVVSEVNTSGGDVLRVLGGAGWGGGQSRLSAMLVPEIDPVLLILI